MVYKVVSKTSIFLRAFIFPNPFTKLFELYLSNSTLNPLASFFADIFNLAIGGTILYILCYSLVGLIYNRGEAPALGSILYILLILINSKLLVWASQTSSTITLKIFFIKFIIYLFIEIIVLISIRYVKEKYI